MKTMDDLRQFLERRARALEASTRQPEMKREALGSKDIDIKNKSENYQSYQSTSMICSFCKQSHRIYTCPKFLNLSIADKYEKVKQLRLCFNCLKEGHGIKTCTSKSTWQKCKRKHHSLLYREEPTSSTFSGNSLYHIKDGNVTENNNCSILLPTAIVSVLNSKNQLIPCRALLDSGSNWVSSRKLCLGDWIWIQQRNTWISVVLVDSRTMSEQALLTSYWTQFQKKFEFPRMYWSNSPLACPAKLCSSLKFLNAINWLTLIFDIPSQSTWYLVLMYLKK